MSEKVNAYQTVGVIGAGAWGTALALSAARAGRDVLLWGRNADTMTEMRRTRRNARYLPDIDLPAAISPSSDAANLKQAGLVLAVVPAQTLSQVLQELKSSLDQKSIIVLAAKGIEQSSGDFLCDAAKRILPDHTIGMLSGPSFAGDVGSGLPTAVSLAFEDQAIGAGVAEALGSLTFRPYVNCDVRGVEIGGALKNVLAIAAGIVAGRQLGESARAALIARGFAEMQRFGTAFGAKPETFGGLSGLGDLVLTSTGTQSRNLRFGILLGQGDSVASAKQKLGTVEGAATAIAAQKIAAAHQFEMPITQAIAAVIEGRESIDAAIERLMRRPLKNEC